MWNLIFISICTNSLLSRDQDEAILCWKYKFWCSSVFCLWIAAARTSSTSSGPLRGPAEVLVLADRRVGKRSSADLESDGLVQASTTTAGILVLGSSWQVLCHMCPSLPYLTLPSGWAGCYTCPALRPFDPMRNPDVIKGHSNRLWSQSRLWSRKNHQPPATGDV